MDMAALAIGGYWTFTQCVHPDGRCAGRRSSNDTDRSCPGGTSSAAAVAPARARASHPPTRIRTSAARWFPGHLDRAAPADCARPGAR
ncbi:hypothetical protein ACHAW5_003236 [Stephanodiscus triporus]|uniref:Uncharacterized protein n=1 Tax=Stephanodiscus triporus TaxID=2934178 RepID=A0ABD3NYI3_9STRA